jgi:hypothetical protein
MNRLLLGGFAACALLSSSILTASAMPVAAPSALLNPDSGVIQVKGGHGHGGGHGWGHHGGRGHHYGWGRGRGHHYGWGHHRW